MVDRFLSARHDNAVRKSIAKFRRLGVDPPRGHAGGHAAKGALATAIKFMKKRCYFRIDISSTAVARAFETARRTAGTPAPSSLNPRNAFCLSEQAEYGVSEFVRGHAGGHYAGAQFALRQVNAQRAHVVSMLLPTAWCLARAKQVKVLRRGFTLGGARFGCHLPKFLRL